MVDTGACTTGLQPQRHRKIKIKIKTANLYDAIVFESILCVAEIWDACRLVMVWVHWVESSTMRLVEGLHLGREPKHLVLFRINYYHPHLADIVWCLSSDIAAGVSFCFCLETRLFLFRNPFLSVCGPNPRLFSSTFHHLSSPFAVVERLRNIIATTDIFYPPQL
jgi:hypothetical protein